ncbi:MAG TPA: acyl-CoA dehydrogenase family protein [Streptosporangiaceae bacterium]|jgi:glutaryl-CoA dehydrogenase|nr:acyl-CoA dehydrogenase family protein [Streptosporangiaceae bacterium]
MPPSTDSASSDLLRIDDELSEEERLVRDTVRDFAADKIMPYIADWFEAGTLPRELAPELGKLGLLGMHLKGYGCAGMGPVAYGVTCREMEAADSGLRSLVSVQGSLAMFPIWKYGSEEQKQEWLPRMAAGEAIGCFGLTEPDHGSDPSSMKTNAKQNGSDWILSGSKMWITNGSIADIAVVWASTAEGIRGFLVPRGTRGFTARNIHKKLSLRASVTSELHFDDVRLPADAVLPGVTGLKGPLSCLSEARFGIVWGVTGAARSCFLAAAEYSRTREQFGRKIGGFQLTQSKLAWMLADLSRAQLLALHLGRLKEAGKITPQQVSLGKMSNVRTAIDIARQARTVLGANGVTLEYPVIRHANNLESVLTYEGTEEIHTLALGQAITGISAYR